IDDELHSVDPADWAGLPVPEKEWLVQDLIPMRKVTALYGDGGIDNTLLFTQLKVSTARGIQFVTMAVREGAAYARVAENDNDDTHRTVDAVCRHYGVGLDELRGKMRIASRAGFDNILMGQGGTPDQLFEHLLADIKKIGPVLVVLDTAADLFGGNEN